MYITSFKVWYSLNPNKRILKKFCLLYSHDFAHEKLYLKLLCIFAYYMRIHI